MSGSHFLKPASTEALQLCCMLSAYPDVKFQGFKMFAGCTGCEGSVHHRGWAARQQAAGSCHFS